jgi:hypothetical protein
MIPNRTQYGQLFAAQRALVPRLSSMVVMAKYGIKIAMGMTRALPGTGTIK